MRGRCACACAQKGMESAPSLRPLSCYAPPPPRSMESTSLRTPTPSRFRLSAAYSIACAGSASIHGGVLPKINDRSRVNGFECAGGIRVAFHGAPGAYSEFASKTALTGCETFPCRAFVDSISAVERSLADRAFLPVESTMDSTALRNHELLLRNDLRVAQEMSLFVNYCLLAVLGVSPAELRRVISHPRAFAQLSLHLREDFEGTAGAVEMLRLLADLILCTLCTS